MGYYYEKARSRKDLTPEQQQRYSELTAKEAEVPQPLHDQCAFLWEYVSPSNGESWSAYNELAEDAIVTWILAGEDPVQVTWSEPKDLKAPPPPPLTPEEQEAARLRSEAFFRQLEENRQERERKNRKEYERQKREYEESRNIFQWIRDLFFPLYSPYDKL